MNRATFPVAAVTFSGVVKNHGYKYIRFRWHDQGLYNFSTMNLVRAISSSLIVFVFNMPTLFHKLTNSLFKCFLQGASKNFWVTMGWKVTISKRYFCFSLLKSLYLSLVKYSHVFIRYVIQLNYIDEIIHPACNY